MRAVVLCLVAVTATASASADSGGGTHHKRPKKHVAHAKERAARTAHVTEHGVTVHDPIRGQSVGAPWDGLLRDAARLPDGDGYVIRRPWRAFGTRTTVDYVLRAITDVREQFPDAHVLAIGDLSAEHGGPISEHRSHQTGRDADIGLVYREKPDNFPHDFVTATEDNLDCAATYALISEFADTSHEDGGVQMMFLDFEVQGIIYRWAQAQGIDDDRLARLFQYPHGRDSSEGLVRHVPNHDNHLHVRFQCPRGDTACR